MTIHRCEKCLKIFNQKSHLVNHLIKRKKPCSSSDILNLCDLINPTESHQNPTNPSTKIPPKTIINNNTINNDIAKTHNDHNVCLYCEKDFSRVDSLQRHLKDRCKIKKKNDDKDSKIQILIEENALLKEIILKNKDVLTTGNIINNNNTTNNSNNTKNSHNNTTNNIQQNVQVNINGFGKEDLDKLNILDAMKVYLKSTGGNIIANMLKYINLNANYPENNNICISDLSREIVKMHNGKKYIYKKFKNAKYDIVDKVVDNIYGIVNKYKDGDYKKSTDINSKLDINETSLKLISGEELENDSDSDSDSDNTENLNSENEINSDSDDNHSRNTQDIIDDLNNMDENIQKMIEKREKDNKIKSKRVNIEHLNSKREGLQQITFEKLKEELRNGKEILP
jgi:hypothetical protein